MCFTVAINTVREELERRYGARFTDPSWFKAGYLFSAFRFPVLPVIPSQEPDHLLPASWGLVPDWVKRPSDAADIRTKTFNARVETMFVKPAFKKAAALGRCLIPVTGFFEWHEGPSGKIPYFLCQENQKLFSLGGLYTEWVNRSTGEVEPTFSMVTMPANPLLEKIHNKRKRMPVIVTPDNEADWLNRDIPQKEISRILQAGRAVDLDYRPVSRKIAGRDADPYDPSHIEAIDYGYDPLYGNLFNPEKNK